MKNLITSIWRNVIFTFLLVFILSNPALATENIDSALVQILEQTTIELQEIEEVYSLQIIGLYQELEKQQQVLNFAKSNDEQTLHVKVNALIKINGLRDAINASETDYQLELSRVRYRKGIELIKIIYEKVLGLDHHFTSLQTYQNVATLSNPNSFPEFQKAQDLLKSRLSKKQAIKMPALLETNPYISMTFTLVSSLFGGGGKKDREDDLNQVACILDFTVRMNSDLNVVYYETEFLKQSNRALKEECIELFKDYAKVVGYRVPLKECRKEDDWEAMYKALDEYMVKIKENAKDPKNGRKVYKEQVELEFAIQRLLQFMDDYRSFISSGEKYYRKFQTILNNYANEDICQSQLPHQFSDLKKDIELSIMKFNEAYNISELQGSKLKDLMYGVQD